MGKLQVNIILEILGKPAENVQTALKLLIERLGKENGVKITEQTIHEPSPLKEHPDLYTAFADLILELDSLDNYFGIIFAYMPAHIELITPEVINLKNEDLNILANKLASRLHDYDAIAKKLLFDNEQLANKLREITKNQLPLSQESSSQQFSSSVKKRKDSVPRKNTLIKRKNK